MRQEYIIASLKDNDLSAVEIAKAYCADHPTELYTTVLSSTKTKLSIMSRQGFVMKKCQKEMVLPSTCIRNGRTHLRCKVWVWGLCNG